MKNTSNLYNLKKLSGVEHPENFAKEVIELFLNNIPVESQKMLQACTEKNWELVYFLAHKMKASIDLLNIEMLKNDIRLVEKFAKGKITVNDIDINEKVNFINNTIQQCAKEMRENLL